MQIDPMNNWKFIFALFRRFDHFRIRILFVTCVAIQGSGCDTANRVFTSDTRGPRFNSSRQQFL